MGRRGKPFTKVAVAHLRGFGGDSDFVATPDKPYGSRTTAYGGSQGLKERERPTRYQQNKLHVDVHGLIFAVLAVVFVVYPLAQWALGR